MALSGLWGTAVTPPDDEVDLACHAWAAQWIGAYANGDGGQIGALACALAGAGTARGPSQQRWPEVYRRDGLMVAVALHAFNPADRLFLFRHYVERWYEPERDNAARWRRRRRPLPQRLLAGRMGLSHGRYLRRRDRLKRRLQARLWPAPKKSCTATSKSVLFRQVVEVSL